jgi:hypothetical protein
MVHLMDRNASALAEFFVFSLQASRSDIDNLLIGRNWPKPDVEAGY